MNILLRATQGFCMAIADSVPGVSGGTIAFILGFYDKLISSLNDLMKGSKEQKIEALKFLFKLGVGWIFGFVASVLLLGKIFDSHIYALCSTFLGLTVFAIPLVLKEEQRAFRGQYKNVGFSLVGFIIVFASVYLNGVISGNATSLEQISIGKMVFVFLGGMIAITAMVLPGISGSTLLLIMGLYVPILNAIRDFLHLNFSMIPYLMVFGVGVLTGIFVNISVVKVCLEKHRSKCMYFILGLLVGSIYAIMQGPTTLDIPQTAINFGNFQFGFFLFGGLILALLQLFKRRTMDKMA